MTPDEYLFEPTAPAPWEHQRRAFLNYCERRYFAYTFEQRCGKSRVPIDEAAYHYEDGRRIDGLLIVAWPNLVHLNWILNEVPAYLPKRIPRRALTWFSGKQSNRTWNREFDELVKTRGMAIFAVNAEALRTKGAPAKAYVHRFIEARKTFLVIDECDFCKSPNALQTQTMGLIAQRPNVLFRRILSGTVATDSPFELYSQYNLLSRTILNCPDYLVFKHRYGEYETEEAWVKEKMRDAKGRAVVHHKTKRPRMVDTDRRLVDPRTGEPKMRIKKGYNHQTGSEFELIHRDDDGNPKYKNLDDLELKIRPHTMRIRRADVSDAPAKVYQSLYYEPSKEQMRVYVAVRDEFEAELSNSRQVEARHVLARILLLQQILGNNLPTREEGQVCGGCDGDGCVACDDLGFVLGLTPAQRVDPNEDPRLEALMAYLERDPVPAIVWARFTAEVDAVTARAVQAGRRVARYDGTVGTVERTRGLTAFQAGDVDLLVGNQDAGGRGLLMDRADLVVYYSNTFSLRTRLQSEDRAEAIRKTTATGVVDLIARDTIDERLVGAHRAKKDVFQMINGDNWKEFVG